MQEPQYPILPDDLRYGQLNAIRQTEFERAEEFREFGFDYNAGMPEAK